MATSNLNCRGCGADLSTVLADLGPAPLANAFIDDVDAVETFYPLRAYVCARCFLVQLPEIASPSALFNDSYAYFSSVSAGFVEHARRFAGNAARAFELGPESRVLEVGANDGYLLQHFQALGMQVLGVDPSANVAAVAANRGIMMTTAFFGSKLAESLPKADLIVANNVLAHVPDLHDFIEGLAIALADGGHISLEFPHALQMLFETQFDTIYHEHYSYMSLIALLPLLKYHGLEAVDVETLPTHGGSLRVTVRHDYDCGDDNSAAVETAIAGELAFGLNKLETYYAFAGRVTRAKVAALEFLGRHVGKVGGYGAPAKANTFLNYCGIKPDLLPWTVDGTPFKQGKFTPGSRIPIYNEKYAALEQPEYLMILAWNWRNEIAARARSLGFKGQFVVALPHCVVL